MENMEKMAEIYKDSRRWVCVNFILKTSLLKWVSNEKDFHGFSYNHLYFYSKPQVLDLGENCTSVTTIQQEGSKFNLTLIHCIETLGKLFSRPYESSLSELLSQL